MVTFCNTHEKCGSDALVILGPGLTLVSPLASPSRFRRVEGRDRLLMIGTTLATHSALRVVKRVLELGPVGHPLPTMWTTAQRLPPSLDPVRRGHRAATPGRRAIALTCSTPPQRPRTLPRQVYIAKKTLGVHGYTTPLSRTPSMCPPAWVLTM